MRLKMTAIMVNMSCRLARTFGKNYIYLRGSKRWQGLCDIQHKGGKEGKGQMFRCLYQWFSTGVPRQSWVPKKALGVPPKSEIYG